MSKNKVKKFSRVDKKLLKFVNENNVQSNNNTVRDIRNKPQTNK